MKVCNNHVTLVSKMARGKPYYFLITHHIWKLETCILTWNNSCIVCRNWTYRDTEDWRHRPAPWRSAKTRRISSKPQGTSLRKIGQECRHERYHDILSLWSLHPIPYPYLHTHQPPFQLNTARNSLFSRRLLGFRRPQLRRSRLPHRNRTRQRRPADLFLVPARPRKWLA